MRHLWQRLQRARREGGLSRAALRWGRNRNPVHRSVLYRTLRAPAQGGSVAENLQISRHTAWTELTNTQQESILDHGGPRMKKEFEHLFQAGSVLWLGELDGRFAGVCWHSRPVNRQDYFVPLTASDTVIYACFVLPEFRGRGIYPRMLQSLITSLLAEGLESVYIDCKIWNQPSIRGIEKAGFEYIGTSWRFVGNSRSYYFWNGCRT